MLAVLNALPKVGGVQRVGDDKQPGGELVAMRPNIGFEVGPLLLDVEFPLQVAEGPGDAGEYLVEYAHYYKCDNSIPGLIHYIVLHY